MRSTFKLLFYLNRGKVKKNGCSPIMGRITIDGKQTQFSTGLEVTSKKWDVKKSVITGRDDDAKVGNEKIKQLRKEAERHYAKLLDRDGYVTAERIKNELLGVTGQIPTLLAEAQSLCEDMRERVGKTHTLSTYKGYMCGYNNLKEFVRKKQGFEDVAFITLEYDFIEDYDFFSVWIKTETQHGKRIDDFLAEIGAKCRAETLHFSRPFRGLRTTERRERT